MDAEVQEQLSRLAGWSVACLATYVALFKFCVPASLTKRKDRLYWASCLIGSAHALYMSCEALRLFISGEVHLWDDFGTRHRVWERSLEFSIGFYVFDTGLTLYSTEQVGRGELLFHHMLALVEHFWPVCACHKFAAVSMLGYLSELSTPLVNARWMLSSAAGGGSSTTLYLVNGVLMMLVFFVSRPVFQLGTLYQLYGAAPRELGSSVGAALAPCMGWPAHLVAPLGVSFYLLNLFWMWKMIKGALKVFGAPKRS